MEFKEKIFNSFMDSFEATHRLVEEIKALPELLVHSSTNVWPKVDFVVNHTDKTAVLLKTVVYISRTNASSGVRHKKKPIRPRIATICI